MGGHQGSDEAPGAHEVAQAAAGSSAARWRAHSDALVLRERHLERDMQHVADLGTLPGLSSLHDLMRAASEERQQLALALVRQETVLRGSIAQLQRHMLADAGNSPVLEKLAAVVEEQLAAAEGGHIAAMADLGRLIAELTAELDSSQTFTDHGIDVANTPGKGTFDIPSPTATALPEDFAGGALPTNDENAPANATAPRSQAESDLLAEIQLLDARLAKLGGRTCGWRAADHDELTRVRAKLGNPAFDSPRLVPAAMNALAAFDRTEIVSHLRACAQREHLLEAKRAVLRRWRSGREVTHDERAEREKRVDETAERSKMEERQRTRALQAAAQQRRMEAVARWREKKAADIREAEEMARAEKAEEEVRKLKTYQMREKAKVKLIEHFRRKREEALVAQALKEEEATRFKQYEDREKRLRMIARREANRELAFRARDRLFARRDEDETKERERRRLELSTVRRSRRRRRQPPILPAAHLANLCRRPL